MILILSSIIVLLLINFLLIIFLKRLNQESKNESTYVNISVVIAAKNEQENIAALFTHLKNLDYPEEKFEVIIVDDNSIDGTLSSLNKNIGSLNNFYVYENEQENDVGKRGALSLAISKSNHEYILITDADCFPERDWLKACSNKFARDYDLIFGVAPFYQHKNLVNRVSCFENLRNAILSFSMASINLSYTAAARNFGFTKKLFDTLGGYSNTKETISGDDDLLLREAVKKNMKIGTVTNRNSFIYSETKKTFSEYFQQRARHTQTSFYYLVRHQLLLGIWHLLNISFVLSPLMIFINPLYGVLFPLKIILDLLTVKFSQKKFGYKFSVFEIFYLQIFYEFFLIVHFFNARFTKVKWKQ